MNIKKILFCASLGLTLSTLVHAYPSKCERFDRRIDKLSSEIRHETSSLDSVRREMNRAEREYNLRDNEIRSARHSLNGAENALRQLRYDYNNADMLIAYEHDKIVMNQQKIIPALQMEAQALANEYDSISGNFFWRLKKMEVKRKWNNKLEDITKKQNEIIASNQEIARIKNLVENFNTMEYSYQDNVMIAQDKLTRVENLYPSIYQLSNDKDRYERDFRAIENGLRRLHDQLFQAKEDKQQCETELTPDPTPAPGPGRHDPQPRPRRR